MPAGTPITDIARVIQLSVAPVFLISMCALLISFVIVSLFISAMGHLPISSIVGGMFIAAMISLIGALRFFLREVFLATRILRIGPHQTG